MIARRSCGKIALGKQMALVMCHTNIYHSTMGKSVGLILGESDLVYKILSLHSHKSGGLNSIDLLLHSFCGSEV